ncbi:MAG: alpha/beta hydrolase [Promethearchaeota archaeon]|jgi:acetyl esterase/lipase
MSYEEISKVHEELGKLMEESFQLGQKQTQEFASQNNVSVEDLEGGNVEPMMIFKFYRYLSDSSGMINNKQIPLDVTIERINIGELPVEWIYVPGASEHKVYLTLFGGGYMMGNLESRRWIPYLLSRTTNYRCLNIGYRLAPEHPFPAALDDSISAYQWLLDKGFDPNNIIIGGESAGGGLTMATLLKLKELKLPLPKAAVMMSPWVDLTGNGKSLETNYKYEPILAEGVKSMGVVYAGGKSIKNPFISPVFADLGGLPPLLIQAGGIEALLDDSILLSERAKSAGVQVTLEVYENMTHVFQSFGDLLSESKKAFDNIKKFIEDLP